MKKDIKKNYHEINMANEYFIGRNNLRGISIDITQDEFLTNNFKI